MRTADDEKHLEDAVRGIAGVYGAVASRTDHCMEVDFEDDEVTVADILGATSAAGFQATLAG
jgi:hypothetical protein